jgi:hypothetical protein
MPADKQTKEKLKRDTRTKGFVKKYRLGSSTYNTSGYTYKYYIVVIHSSFLPHHRIYIDRSHVKALIPVIPDILGEKYPDPVPYCG